MSSSQQNFYSISTDGINLQPLSSDSKRMAAAAQSLQEGMTDKDTHTGLDSFSELKADTVRSLNPAVCSLLLLEVNEEIATTAPLTPSKAIVM